MRKLQVQGSAPLGAEPGERPIFRGHIQSLDGLRGLAILLVLTVHLWRPETRTALGMAITRTARAGWTGVDLFFVLSGFLITGLLIDSRARPNFLRNFFARRALRILPLYTLFLVVSLVLLPLWFDHLGLSQRPSFGNRADAAHWPWYALFVSNYWMALADRFPAGWSNSLTWSLAVEEQFYLLWPWLILVCPPRWLPRAIGFVFAAAIAARAFVVWLDAGWLTAALVTPCRMDALAAGGWVAAYLRSPGFQARTWRWLLRGAVALALPAAAVWILWEDGDPRTGAAFQVVGYSLLAVAGAGLLGAALTGDPPVLRPLRSSPLVALGKVSYGIYLFHLVLFTAVLPVAYKTVLALTRWQIAERFFWWAFGVAGSWLLAWFLYRAVEAPCLRLKERFRTPTSDTADLGAPNPLPSGSRSPATEAAA